MKENVHAFGERKSNSTADNPKLPDTGAVVLLKSEAKDNMRHCGSLDEWWTRLLVKAKQGKLRQFAQNKNKVEKICLISWGRF